MSQRRKQLFQKQWQLVLALQAHPRGVSRRRLIEETELPSTTLHRCINELRDFGVPIETDTANGETRYRLAAPAFPSLGISATQLLALRFARRALAALDGTHITRELDVLLAPHATRDAAISPLSTRAPASSPTHGLEVADILERAIVQRRRVQIRVATRERPEPHHRVLDPICLRYAGATLYLAGYDIDKQAARTFKLARITHAQKLTERCDEHPGLDEDTLFADAIKVGSGAPVEIAIRYAPRVANIAREYQLSSTQTLTDEPSGHVVLRATVAGLEEVKRFILSWGQDAAAIEPKALRDAIARELRAAAKQYPDSSIRKAGPNAKGRDRVVPRIADRG